MKSFFKSLLQHKTIVMLVLTMVFVAIFAIQVTTALFFGENSAFSTIIIGNLDVSSTFLSQTGGNLNIDTPSLLPGEIISRTLQIQNNENSMSAYVRIKTIFYIDSNDNGIFEELEESLAVQMQLATGQTGWIKDSEGPQYWFYYDGTLLSNQTITVNLEFVVFPIPGNDAYFIGNEDSGKDYKIEVTVNAVQSLNNGTGYGDVNTNWLN